MARQIGLAFTIILLGAVSASSQTEADTMYDRISTCAAGANLDISSDLKGSLKDILSGQGADGVAKVSTQTEWLKLFPEKDRLEAARLYHACISQGRAKVGK